MGTPVDAVESRRSPFYAAQAALGATFMEEAGWVWTNGFGDLDREYRAVREDLGVWDVSPLNKWDVRGREALRAAERLHSNDVRHLKTGQVRYGAFCDEQGRMIDDGTVFKLEDDHAWLMTNGREHDAHFSEVTRGLNATIEYIGPQLPHLGLQGPRSREALAAVCSVDLRRLPYFHFVPGPVRVGGVPCWVSRTGFGGELGYELFCRPEDAPALWDVVVSRCRATPFGVEAIEILRIEAGLVILDYDYEPHQRTPYDLSFDRFVALGRSDFLGATPLTAIAASPPRRFKTLVLESDQLPEYGARVSRDGRPIGTLTSPTRSPRFGMIGLAVLDAADAQDGRPVEVAVGERWVPARVATLPIYDPEKQRPRA
ncbi:MAG TPA: aminomethyltransferase family protein [Candidatus Limnocylindrales bacterium]|nr:aminomethyltransferase family protein [Candidatus Limnocylindrales bacterium]